MGLSVSIDAKMTDVGGVKPSVAVFNQSKGMDSVIPKVNLFATDINERVFGRVVQRPREEPSGAVPSRAPVDIYAHPEKLLGETGGYREETSGLNPDFIMAAGRKDASSFWKSQNFDKNIKAMGIGDVDGD